MRECNCLPNDGGEIYGTYFRCKRVPDCVVPTRCLLTDDEWARIEGHRPGDASATDERDGGAGYIPPSPTAERIGRPSSEVLQDA